MNDQDREQFGLMWASVRVDVYDKPITAEGISLVFKTLERYSIDQIRSGIQAHVNDTQNGQYPITPSHVVAQIEGRGEERAAAAWMKLYKAIGSVGNYSDVVFDDPVIHVIVMNSGGWEKVCFMTEDDLKFMQGRFGKQYIEYVSRSGDFKYPKVLRGTINADRASKGLDLDPPAVIGDVPKARLVYRDGVEAELIEISKPELVGDVIALPNKPEAAA